MTRRIRLKGRTAVITGAGGGIGRALALGLARRGCHLILADIDGAAARATAAVAETNGVRAEAWQLDVADREAVTRFGAAMRARGGAIDLLINNAGVALGGTFEQVAESDFDWLIEINFAGLVRMTRAFLPMLHASDDARLVNLSSIFGIVAPPGQAAYAASKFAVRGFSEALRHELAGSTVGVTVVHPGGVATAIAASARAPQGASEATLAAQRAHAHRMLRLRADVAAEIILRAVERRRGRVLVGTDAKLAERVQRWFPVRYWNILRRAA